MKLNILVNGKTGIINLTHSTFIVEDLKAHICKKMGLDANSYKMKIDFSFNHIELIQTKGNPSFSSNQKTVKTKTVKAKTASKKDSAKYMEQKKKYLRDIWRNREMLSDFDIINETNFKEIEGDDLYRFMKLKINKDIRGCRRLFQSDDLYILLVSSKVLIGSKSKEKQEIFDSRNRESVEAFFQGGL